MIYEEQSLAKETGGSNQKIIMLETVKAVQEATTEKSQAINKKLVSAIKKSTATVKVTSVV